MTREEIREIAALIAATLDTSQDRRTERNFSEIRASLESLERTALAHQALIEDHDRQLAQQAADTAALKQLVADVSREWQAYLRTRPPH